MSALTSILGLLKKSPTTDGADVFNLDTILNDNWDKLDAAVGARSGSCSDAAASTAKAVTIAWYKLLVGVPLAVTFVNGNSASALTLNVSSSGAKPVKCRGSTALTAAMLPAGHLAQLVYDGTAYWLLNPRDLANVSHTHAQSDVTGLGDALSSKQDTTLSQTTGTSPADADYISYYDISDTSNKKTLWSNVKAALRTYFDTLYAAANAVTTHNSASDAHSALFAAKQSKITASGVLKGNGSAVSAAVRGTDYSLVNAPVVASVPYTGWVKNATTNAYEQSVAVAGLLTTDDKRTRVECVGSTDVAAQALIDAAYANVSYVACVAAGYLYLRCDSAAPETTFSVAVVIER